MSAGRLLVAASMLPGTGPRSQGPQLAQLCNAPLIARPQACSGHSGWAQEAAEDATAVLVANRSGGVLGPHTILKEDHFPGCQSSNLPPILPGVPNFRGVGVRRDCGVHLGFAACRVYGASLQAGVWHLSGCWNSLHAAHMPVHATWQAAAEAASRNLPSVRGRRGSQVLNALQPPCSLPGVGCAAGQTLGPARAMLRRRCTALRCRPCRACALCWTRWAAHPVPQPMATRHAHPRQHSTPQALLKTLRASRVACWGPHACWQQQGSQLGLL